MTVRPPTRSEQKLANISVQLAITAAQFMQGKTTEEVAKWAAGQLNDCGFKNTPVGMNWAYLTGVYE